MVAPLQRAMETAVAAFGPPLPTANGTNGNGTNGNGTAAGGGPLLMAAQDGAEGKRVARAAVAAAECPPFLAHELCRVRGVAGVGGGVSAGCACKMTGQLMGVCCMSPQPFLPRRCCSCCPTTPRHPSLPAPHPRNTSACIPATAAARSAPTARGEQFGLVS